jgi:8-oxo-dGTP pyrophosphatase MutT (NUDIX family)
MTKVERPRRAEVAVGLIVAEDGRLLLQHRDDRPEINGAGLWGLFGGHIEPGETHATAFLREVGEELGWRPRHFEYYLTRDTEYHRDDRGYSRDAAFRSHVFAAHLDLPVEELTLGEGQALALFPLAALPDPLLPRLADVIDEFVRTDAYKRVKRRWDLISTTGLLVDANGRFMLQLRDDRPDILNPGLWGSFGGRLEPYETPDEGFLRELQEELGWRPASHELYISAPLRTLASDDTRSQLIYIYAAPVDVPLDAMVLGEGQALDAFAPDALPENTVPALRGLIERFAATETYRATVLRAAGR